MQPKVSEPLAAAPRAPDPRLNSKHSSRIPRPTVELLAVQWEHPERRDEHVPVLVASPLLTVATCATDRDPDNPRRDPLVILALDSANAYNTLTRTQLTAVLQQGCAHFVHCPADPQSPAQPAGCDILWQQTHAHYGCKGTSTMEKLECPSLAVKLAFSKALCAASSVQHSVCSCPPPDPILTNLQPGQHHRVLFTMTAYADNVVISGTLIVCSARKRPFDDPSSTLAFTSTPRSRKCTFLNGAMSRSPSTRSPNWCPCLPVLLVCSLGTTAASLLECSTASAS
jgi:hypothetical protein